MNFEFSDDVDAMRDEVRTLLRNKVPAGSVRSLISSGKAFDSDLWREIGALGWMGISLPENHGGSGLDMEPLCMIAEEIGYSAAAVPFSSSIYLAADAIARFGSEDQKQAWLGKLARGEAIGAFAMAEGNGQIGADRIAATFADGKLGGLKFPVWDGLVADVLVVVAKGADGAPGLYLAAAADCRIEPVRTLEYSRSAASIDLAGVTAEPLPGAQGWDAIAALLDRAGVLFAFEAVGGARAVLDMAVDYAKQRYAFGRAIGSLQAIKHMLADVFVAIELARSNAYFGAWALSAGDSQLPLAAATCRLAATRAYELASAQAIQVHGGMGFTQEVDCHLHYRRAKRLAVEVGDRRYWTNRLIAHLPAGEGN